MLYSTVYSHAELGDLIIASDGEAIVGLWIEGQKYFAGKVAGNLERQDDLPVFARRTPGSTATSPAIPFP